MHFFAEQKKETNEITNNSNDLSELNQVEKKALEHKKAESKNSLQHVIGVLYSGS